MRIVTTEDDMGKLKIEPDISDHELLIRIDERTGATDKRTVRIDERISNHLRHHWTVTVAILVSFLSVCGAFFVRWFWGK